MNRNNRADCISRFGLLFDGFWKTNRPEPVAPVRQIPRKAKDEHDPHGDDPITIGVPKETARDESRVALTPTIIAGLLEKGIGGIMVETGAGVGSEITDCEYEDAGATIIHDPSILWAADIVVHVRPPSEHEASLMGPGSVLISFISPSDNGPVIDILSANGVTCFAMDLIPRISRAQWFDALSSMANIAGYRAVLEASTAFGRYFCRQSTAAGVSQPARVLIIGIGVAGLQAIATAKRLGCVVRCMDPRPETRAQAESLGALYVDVPIEECGAGAGGYARTMSPQYIAAQKATIASECAAADVVITTALVPGRPAPLLITREAVLGMRSGAVIVDLAAERGGNCELTQRDETVIIEPVGVRIIGDTNLTSRMAPEASSMYANNVAKFLLYIFPRPRGRLQDRIAGRMDPTEGNPDMDPLLVAAAVSHGGASWYPVAATHPHIMDLLWPKKVAVVAEDPARRAAVAEAARASSERATVWLTAGAVAAATAAFGGLFAVGMFAPAAYINVGTFGLSLVIGYHTVQTCEAALHSPFMALTNALSGVAVVGGIMLATGGWVPSSAGGILASASVFLSSLNLFGGFRVTQRTLDTLAAHAPREPATHLPLWLYAAPAGLATGFVMSVAAVGAPAASMLAGIIPLGYLGAGLLTAGGMASFRSPGLAQIGTVVGASAMALGTVAAVAELYPPAALLMQLVIAAGAGGVVGVAVADHMDGAQELPQMVALFHSSVGAAAALTSFGSLIALGDPMSLSVVGHRLAGAMGVVMGAITCTGSLVAFAKLADIIPGKAAALPGRDYWNAAMLGGTVACVAGAAAAPAGAVLLGCAGGAAALSAALGVHLTSGIGGADMPVVVTVLNSYSGWALVAEGFVLHNELLLIAGSLIGASGAKLTAVMCSAMNRSLASVVLGGAGTGNPSAHAKGREEVGEVRETTPHGAADALASAASVVIVPGYGMAQARAQTAVADISTQLQNAGVQVTYAVHAVAGRMPGQMNCLLGEASVPYEIVKEGDDVNDHFHHVDVVLIVGANDICNSDAVDDPNCELAGMPVLRVWESRQASQQVIFLKRSLGAGYVGVENPVFFKPNTHMLFGDAKASCEAIGTALRQWVGAVGSSRTNRLHPSADHRKVADENSGGHKAPPSPIT